MADDDISDEDLETFGKYLDTMVKKKGPAWLKGLLEEPTTTVQTALKKPASEEGLSAFLEKLLEKEEKARLTLSERLERVMELLTPEQLIQLRSPKPVEGAASPTPKPKEPPPTPPNEPAPRKRPSFLM